VSERYDVVVLGGGTGGLVSALVAADVGARVALIERERTGGECLWTGCVPSKSLIAAATLAHRMRHADSVGLAPTDPNVDFATVMARVQRAIRTIEPQDSPERLRNAGVDVVHGSGRFAGPGRIEVEERELRWRSAIIATGSTPLIPAIRGLDDAEPLTTDTVWQLRELPRRLVVLGGGPVGCELAQAFARLGSHVTVIELADRLLLKEEPRASELIASRLREERVDVRLGQRASEVRRRPGGDHELLLEGSGEALSFERIIVATGRAPSTGGLGLEAVGVELDRAGAVAVNSRLRTSAHGIFAVGDVTGLLPFTHVAAHHARVATPNALFKARGKVSKTIPWVTFTDPEVGRVGLSEGQARERWGEKVKITEFDYAKLDRAITAGEAYGFARLIADPRGRLVGATVAAPGGGDAIAELTAWISRRQKIDAVSRTVHAYPTLAEGSAAAADEYLEARYSSPRMRALTRRALAVLRLLHRRR
jgi:pyruvate/2-oxoglutarate dehydrogenase complex dihydrolipoamide dehydrogenase (E3) component